MTDVRFDDSAEGSGAYRKYSWHSEAEKDFSVWPFRSEPFRSGRFGLAASVAGHFGQTMKFCRNLTLMQSRAV